MASPGMLAGRLAGLLAGLLPSIGGAGAHMASETPAAVVVLAELSADGVLEAARSQRPALWRRESLAGQRAPVPPSVEAEVERLRQAYLEADFLRCLVDLQNPALNLDRLLEHGRREDAARVGSFAAGCALGAGDEARARELVGRLLVRELDAPEVLRRMTPELQQLAEDERQKAQRWGRVGVAVSTQPDGASVRVDGAASCTAAPCRLNLLRGDHILVAEKIGYRRRVVPVLLEDEQTVTLTLEPAPAEEAGHQLALTVGTGADPSCIEMARTATTAFGVGLVVLVWERSGKVHANAFQRNRDAFTHVALDAEPTAAARAVAAALAELPELPELPGDSQEPTWWRYALSNRTGLAVAFLTAVAMFLLGRRTVRS